MKKIVIITIVYNCVDYIICQALLVYIFNGTSWYKKCKSHFHILKKINVKIQEYRSFPTFSVDSLPWWLILIHVLYFVLVVYIQSYFYGTFILGFWLNIMFKLWLHLIINILKHM